MRDWGASAQSALAAASLPVLVFVELDFSSGFVRVCNASHSVDWNGFTWAGLGALGKIEALTEGADLEARGLAFELSGVPSAYLATALNENYQGRSVKMWAAPLDANNAITDVRQIYIGRMDTMTIVDGENATVRVTSESRLADMQRPRVRRYNDADQQSIYSGDKGLEYVEYLASDRVIKWGQA